MARTKVEQSVANAKKVQKMGVDIRKFNKKQQKEFLEGFNEFVKGKRVKKETLQKVEELVTNTIVPEHRYNDETVDLINEYIVSKEYNGNKGRKSRQVEEARKVLSSNDDNMKYVWDHLSRDKQIELSLNTPESSSVYKGSSQERNKRVWQAAVASLTDEEAVAMVREINHPAKRSGNTASEEVDLSNLADLIDAPERESAAARAKRMQKIREALSSNDDNMKYVWDHLSRDKQIEASLNTPESSGVYSGSSEDRNRRVMQTAINNLTDEEATQMVREINHPAKRKTPRKGLTTNDEENVDISNLAELADVEEAVVESEEDTPNPTLFEREAKPFIDNNRPALKKARRRAIIELVAGGLALNFGLDIAATTLAVVPALALTGPLIPVVGLLMLGGAATGFGIANVVKAVRYSRLARHLTRAYTCTNKKGQRLTKLQRERSIHLSRRLIEKLGLTASARDLSVLNKSLKEYKTVTQRAKNYGSRMNKKLDMWAEDRRELGAERKQLESDLNARRKVEDQKIKRARQAIKIDEKAHAAGRPSYVDRQAAEEAIVSARAEKSAINRLNAEGNAYLREEAAARKNQRAIKGLSDQQKKQLLREFKEELGQDGLEEFNGLSAEEREARVKQFITERLEARKLVNRVRGTSRQRTQTNTTTNTNNGPRPTPTP